MNSVASLIVANRLFKIMDLEREDSKKKIKLKKNLK